MKGFVHNGAGKLPYEVRKYLSDIGRKGGKGGKRKLTKKDARQMAAKRWQQTRAEVADATATVRARARGSKNTTAQESNGGDDRFSPAKPSVNT